MGCLANDVHEIPSWRQGAKSRTGPCYSGDSSAPHVRNCRESPSENDENTSFICVCLQACVHSAPDLRVPVCADERAATTPARPPAAPPRGAAGTCSAVPTPLLSLLLASLPVAAPSLPASDAGRAQGESNCRFPELRERKTGDWGK